VSEEVQVQEGVAEPVELTPLGGLTAIGAGAFIVAVTLLPIVLAVLIAVWTKRIERHTAAMHALLIEMMRRNASS